MCGAGRPGRIRCDVTKSREWPNNAAWARDRAAEELESAVRMLQPLVRGERFDSTETLRRVAGALDGMQTALRHLERAGAQTRPE